MKTIISPEMMKDFIQTRPIAALVFSTKTCVVCKPLKVKIKRVIEEELRETSIEIAEVFIEDVEMVKGLYQVYTAPIILLFIDGKEVKRYSAAIDFHEFTSTVTRYHHLLNS